MANKTTELRDLTRDELIQRRTDLVDERFNLTMRRSLKPLDNPLRLREVRREIARINTVLAEDEQGIRKLAEQKSSLLGDEKKAE
jgi:large subunit ribosomal protein L29